MAYSTDDRICHCCGAVTLTSAGVRMLLALADQAEALNTTEIAKASGNSRRNVRRIVTQWDDLFAYGPMRGTRKTYKLSAAGKEAAARLREGGAG